MSRTEIRTDGAEEQTNSGTKTGAVVNALRDAHWRTAWIKDGTVILDAEGRIKEASASFRAWLAAPDAEPLAGQLLVETVARKIPAWRQPITTFLAHPDAFSSAQLQAGSRDHATWFHLECARCEGLVFLRLESVLPPLAELQEESWDWFLQNDGARRELFIRLVEAETQLKSLFSRWPGVIFSQRADFSLSSVSPNIVELTGVPAENWRRQPNLFWETVHEADLEELRKDIRELSREHCDLVIPFRIRHAKTGRVAYVLEHRRAFFSESGLVLGYEVFWIDVTRQTVAEKRLSNAAWKGTLAALTMGLAHDFGNILAGIHSLSEAILAQTGADSEFRESLGLIRANSMQASQLVHRLMGLHRGKLGDLNYYNLNELASETLDLMRKVVSRLVEMKLELTDDALPIHVDALEFRQVLINLILNAADAMNSRGTITITTRRAAVLPALPHSYGIVSRHPVVAISVADTGCGIPDRHLHSIFDAFFTTKPAHQGSGLGLYNARLFAEKHHGAISVDSREDQGSTFTVWLPEADFLEGERIQAESRQRRHTLLLVGAAGKSLDQLVDFLRQQGFYTAPATTEAAAVEMLRSPDYQFTALVSLPGPASPCSERLLHEARGLTPPARTVLYAAGCNVDELNTSLTNYTDLIIPSDAPPLELAIRLKQLLERP
jgi:PAS domain S-box-containing protein